MNKNRIVSAMLGAMLPSLYAYPKMPEAGNMPIGGRGHIRNNWGPRQVHIANKRAKRLAASKMARRSRVANMKRRAM